MTLLLRNDLRQSIGGHFRNQAIRAFAFGTEWKRCRSSGNSTRLKARRFGARKCRRSSKRRRGRANAPRIPVDLESADRIAGIGALAAMTGATANNDHRRPTCLLERCREPKDRCVDQRQDSAQPGCNDGRDATPDLLSTSVRVLSEHEKLHEFHAERSSG
jgi:hypothetical protein